MRLKVLLLIAALVLSGCTVRTYKLTRDRIDQDVSAGNRGYLQGQAPAAVESPDKKTTRSTQVVEVEFRPLIKFEKGSNKEVSQTTAPVEAPVSEETMGNRGYITESETLEMSEPVGMEKYKVQRGDTLQKISSKFYGTSKKWNKIYQVNKDVLKGPNKLYPGQIINIPEAGAHEKRAVPKGLK